ncbi:SPOR domain-containing protein [Propionivibrio limicola]|uniref:SPOR domain-containing protein n=1 Tax=Propionivibrio limicola TaxID=167645 RepID=UPI001291839A|nr:SPOR domain-containing protein [Propionivibrio limicola]
MPESPDAHLLLKKRARRRLVGAVAFAGLAAVILPMVMDEEPRQAMQEVQIRIPGQDQPLLNPLVVKPVAVAEVPEAEGRPENPQTVAAAVVPESVKAESKSVEKLVEKVAKEPIKEAHEKIPEKAPEKTAETKKEKNVDKSLQKIVSATSGEAERAAAILDGKPSEPPATKSGATHVILIGAFSNPANVRQLQTKIGELGIKVFTESVNSPGGKKTRVRAGPFATREAADKALEKMKRIGVNGVVASKQ